MEKDEICHGIELTTLDVTAPLRFPQPIAIPRVALRLYEPSTLLETQALREVKSIRNGLAS